MRCPSCRSRISERQLACGQCGFSLQQIGVKFGELPHLEMGVSDHACLMGVEERDYLRNTIEQFELQFPQIKLSVLTLRLAEEVNLSEYAFWIFNKTGVCSLKRKGPKNRNILLTIDGANSRAHLTVGYGLEPFVGEVHLNELAKEVFVVLGEHRYLEGSVAIIQGLEAMLKQICSALTETYGFDAEIREIDDIEEKAPTEFSPI